MKLYNLKKTFHKSIDDVKVTFKDFLLPDSDFSAAAIIPHVGHHVHTLVLILSKSEHDF